MDKSWNGCEMTQKGLFSLELGQGRYLDFFSNIQRPRRPWCFFLLLNCPFLSFQRVTAGSQKDSSISMVSKHRMYYYRAVSSWWIHRANLYRPRKITKIMKCKCPTMGCGTSAQKRACCRAAWCSHSSSVQSRACFLLQAPGQICWFSSRKVRRDQPGSWCHYSSPEFPQFASSQGRGMVKGGGMSRWIFQVTPGERGLIQSHTEQWVCFELLVRNWPLSPLILWTCDPWGPCFLSALPPWLFPLACHIDTYSVHQVFLTSVPLRLSPCCGKTLRVYSGYRGQIIVIPQPAASSFVRYSGYVRENMFNSFSPPSQALCAGQAHLEGWLLLGFAWVLKKENTSVILVGRIQLHPLECTGCSGYGPPCQGSVAVLLASFLRKP